MQCRLCLNSNPQLLWNDAKEDRSVIKTVRWYILQATGIQIEDTDLVPCVLCHSCIKIIINIYWFRKDAIRNDKWLKEQFGQNYIPPLPRFEDIEIPEEEKCNLPEFVKDILVKRVYFENTVKTEPDALSDGEAGNLEVVEHAVQTDDDVEIKTEPERPQSPEKVFLTETHVHSTVEKLLVANPGLNIPENVRSCHINPVIELSPFEKPKIQNHAVSKEFFTTSLQLAPAQNTHHNAGLVRTGRSELMYMCFTCNQLFTSQRRLNLHKKTHFTCKVCYASYPKRSLLEKHKQEYHADIERPLSYSITNSGNMKLTLQKNGVRAPRGVAPAEKDEADYVKYLLVNRYMHKTQQETQTDHAHLLEEPVTEANAVKFKGVIGDLETFKVPVAINVSDRGLSGRIVHGAPPAKPDPVAYDFSHITPTDVVPVSNERAIIDLVNPSSPGTNTSTSARRRRTRSRSCSNLQNLVVNCDSDSDSDGGNAEDQRSPTTKKLRVKELWEIEKSED